MLELEVIPERSLGCEGCEFKLGMPFSQAVFILQRNCRTITCVEVIYVENDPLSADLTLRLPNDGIRLIFDSIAQRLKTIEVYDMYKVKLKYSGVLFCSTDCSPTRELIDSTFGATRPPEYDSTQQAFVLIFRGVSFCFPGIVNKTSQEQLASRPAGRATSVASKMFMYSGSSLAESRTLDLPWHCFNGATYLSSLDVVRDNGKSVGIQVHLMFESIENCPTQATKIKSDARTICFGDTVQDVLSLLGAPSRVFYKAEDKMKIHAPPDQHARKSSDRSDYFYNYFTLGLDILFDAVSQRAKKFVLHTNYPGHYDFNIYYRCFFKIPLVRANHQDNLPESSALLDQNEPMIIASSSKWGPIHSYVLGPDARPIVLNRSSSVNATNPFGATYCYGYQDMIFEVMPNGHIASVSLYEMND